MKALWPGVPLRQVVTSTGFRVTRTGHAGCHPVREFPTFTRFATPIAILGPRIARGTLYVFSRWGKTHGSKFRLQANLGAHPLIRYLSLWSKTEKSNDYLACKLIYFRIPDYFCKVGGFGSNLSLSRRVWACMSQTPAPSSRSTCRRGCN